MPTAIMFGVAMLGGFVAFYRKWKDGSSRIFNITELIGEMVVAGICGVVAYWGFIGLGTNPYLAASGCAVAGHMGSRAMFMAEKMLESAVYKWTGNDRRDDLERRDTERREEAS